MSIKKDKEAWKLWDALFTSGTLSFLKDSHDAKTNEKKFNQLLLQVIVGIVFTASLFCDHLLACSVKKRSPVWFGDFAFIVYSARKLTEPHAFCLKCNTNAI